VSIKLLVSQPLFIAKKLAHFSQEDCTILSAFIFSEKKLFLISDLE